MLRLWRLPELVVPLGNENNNFSAVAAVVALVQKSAEVNSHRSLFALTLHPAPPAFLEPPPLLELLYVEAYTVANGKGLRPSLSSSFFC